MHHIKKKNKPHAVSRTPDFVSPKYMHQHYGVRCDDGQIGMTIVPMLSRRRCPICFLIVTVHLQYPPVHVRIGFGTRERRRRLGHLSELSEKSTESTESSERFNALDLVEQSVVIVFLMCRWRGRSVRSMSGRYTR